MTVSADFDRLLDAWLETEGPQDVPEQVVSTAFAEARSMAPRQPLIPWLDRRAWPGARRGATALPARRPVLIAALTIAGLLGLALAAAMVGSRPADPAGPPGRFLAVGRDDGLFLVRENGSDWTPIFTDGGPYIGPLWSPSGGEIAVTAGHGAGRRLLVIDLHGTTLASFPIGRQYLWNGGDLILEDELGRQEAYTARGVPLAGWSRYDFAETRGMSFTGPGPERRPTFEQGQSISEARPEGLASRIATGHDGWSIHRVSPGCTSNCAGIHIHDPARSVWSDPYVWDGSWLTWSPDFQSVLVTRMDPTDGRLWADFLNLSTRQAVHVTTDDRLRGHAHRFPPVIALTVWSAGGRSVDIDPIDMHRAMRRSAPRTASRNADLTVGSRPHERGRRRAGGLTA